MNRLPPASPARATAPVYKICIRGENPNHHLWNNHGTWFVHYTIHPTRSTKERIRRSLGTRDLFVARELRDRFFEELAIPTRSSCFEHVAS